MPGSEHLIPFVVATFLFAVMPGPALLYTTAQTLARGRAGGLLAVAGIHVGGLAYVVASALGLAAIFHAVPPLYLAMKLVGALYLVWLGVGMLRAKTAGAPLPGVRGRGAKGAFAESVLVEILNPKTALFFIAFLPQFADPAAALPLWAQLLVLGWIVNMAFTAADLVAVVLTSAVIARLRRSGAVQRIARLLGGSILIGLGAHLAVSRS